MGRKTPKAHAKTTKKEELAYPSRFGSHQTMVTTALSSSWVICEDEKGSYATQQKFLDSGVADPHRFSTSKGYRKQLLKYLDSIDHVSDGQGP